MAEEREERRASPGHLEEPAGQLVRGGPGGGEVQGGVHAEVGEASLPLDRHLRGHPSPRILLREPVPLAKAGHLLLGAAVDDHQAVEPEMHPRFHEEGGVRHQHAGGAGGERAEPSGLLLADAGVYEAVQALAGLRVPKDDVTEGAPVDRPILGQDPRAEDGHHVVVGGPAPLHQLVGHAVEVEGGKASGGHAAENLGLAASDAAREPDPQHVTL
jgi:hypothetical protein